jgi:hypothetical protein
VWSFRKGLRISREAQGRRAASELLEVLYFCDQALPMLPHTDNSPGSPLSYGERQGIARPMLDRLSHAEFTLVPQVTSPELAKRFSTFAKLCQHISGPQADALHVHSTVEQVRGYDTHIRACLVAYIDGKPLPAPADVATPDRASHDRRAHY